jgi:hypothetical protein
MGDDRPVRQHQHRQAERDRVLEGSAQATIQGQDRGLRSAPVGSRSDAGGLSRGAVRQRLPELYVGQQVRLTADNRELAEWVAHGEYPIGIGLVQFAVEIFRNPVSPSRRSTDPPEQSLNERQIERRDQWRPHRIAKLTRPIIAALAAELRIVAEKSARRNLKAAGFG